MVYCFCKYNFMLLNNHDTCSLSRKLTGRMLERLQKSEQKYLLECDAEYYTSIKWKLSVQGSGQDFVVLLKLSNLNLKNPPTCMDEH